MTVGRCAFSLPDIHWHNKQLFYPRPSSEKLKRFEDLSVLSQQFPFLSAWTIVHFLSQTSSACHHELKSYQWDVLVLPFMMGVPFGVLSKAGGVTSEMLEKYFFGKPNALEEDLWVCLYFALCEMRSCCRLLLASVLVQIIIWCSSWGV